MPLAFNSALFLGEIVRLPFLSPTDCKLLPGTRLAIETGVAC